MQSDYSEIPGVFSESPRSFVGLRRFYRTYKYCIGAVAFVIGVVLLAALVSVLIGSSIEKSNNEKAAELKSSSQSNASLEHLKNLKWPRKDEYYYHNRWRDSNLRCPFSSNGSSDQLCAGIRRTTRDLRGKEDQDDDTTFAPDDTFYWNRRPSLLPPCSVIQIGDAMVQGERQCSNRKEIEDNIEAKNITLKRHSPSYYHQKGFMKTDPKALKMSQKGYLMDHATKSLSQSLDIDKEASTFDAQWLSELRESPYCSNENEGSHLVCAENDKFRSADGSCNNIKHPTWGAAFTAFRRVLPPDYNDGVFLPRHAKDGSDLPSARKISTSVHYNRRRDTEFSTHLTMSWGQFLDHDITATAQGKGKNGESISCCSEEVRNDSRLLHPECFPIKIPQNDTFFKSKNQTCMEFVRSSSSSRCKFGPRQQINQLTHFIDGSTIYGSSSEQQNELRLHSNGLLKAQVTTDGRSLLPPSLNPNDSCNVAQQMLWKQYCFVSGDSRVNEHSLLTIMHTLWMRHHNSVADILIDINPHWDDEKLFQESRRIVIAQIQHITYNEYLPTILGIELCESLLLLPRHSGEYFEGYMEDLHPGIANGFAAAAFRFGHSMIQGLVQSVGIERKNVKFEQLRKYYFNPFSLYDPTTISGFVRGIVSQKSAAVDTYFTNQVTEHLFQSKESSFGLDLVAVNIQRARDHGVPGYTRWRMMCGLPLVRNFSELAVDLDAGALRDIQEVYNEVDDIDLFTGGLAELPIKGALVGPTFACIIADQFVRLKRSDRFWYENSNSSYPFTKEQLKEIHKTTLARILCGNTQDLLSVQRWALQKFAADNPRFSCSSGVIPSPDYEVWEEGGLFGL